jgi:hypothetical protein
MLILVLLLLLLRTKDTTTTYYYCGVQFRSDVLMALKVAVKRKTELGAAGAAKGDCEIFEMTKNMTKNALPSSFHSPENTSRMHKSRN